MLTRFWDRLEHWRRRALGAPGRQVFDTGLRFGRTGRRSAPRYAAFISYRHRSSREFAENLELALKAYAKPLWKPPMAIFRDEKYLVPGRAIDELVQDALENSGVLIYLASPDAAQSDWVADELRIWCRVLNRTDDLVIVLTDGTIAYDPVTKDLHWDRTDCLPGVLSGAITKVPLFVDARAFTLRGTQTLANSEFLRSVNQIAAKLRGIDPIEMSGVEMRQHRRNIRLRNGLFAAVAVSAVGFAAAAYLAESNLQRAEAQVQETLRRESGLLAAASRQARERGDHPQALRQALDGLPRDLASAERPLVDEVAGALIEAVSAHRLADTVGDTGQWSRALAVSADARLVLYGSDDGEAVLWRRDPAPEVLMRVELSNWVVAAEFSTDGRLGLVASLDGDVVVVETETGVRTTVATGLRIETATFSPDARLTALGTRDGTVQILETATGNRLQTHAAGGELISFLRFTPDGKRLIAAGHDNRARLVDIDGGRLEVLPVDMESWIVAADLSPDGTILATASIEHGARLWSLPEGFPLKELDRDGAIEDIRFSTDGGMVVTGGRDGAARVWSVPAGTPLATFPHPRHVTQVSFLNDGEHSVTGDEDGSARLWRVADGREVAMIGRHDNLGQVSRLEVAGNGIIASSSSGGAVRLWHAWPPAGAIFEHNDTVAEVAFSPDGTKLLASVEDYTCRVWDLESRTQKAVIGPAETTQSWCEWTAGGRQILFFTFDEDTLQIRDPATGDRIGAFTGHHAAVSSAVVGHPDGPAVTATLDNALFLWPEGSAAGSVELGELPDWISGLAILEARRQVIASAFDGTVATWTLDRPHARTDLPLRGRVRLSPDGRRLLVISDAGSVNLLDPATLARLDGFEAGSAVTTVAVFSDAAGAIAVTGVNDAVWLWRAGSPPLKLMGHAGWPTALAFDPAGRRLASAAVDGTVRLWRVSDGVPLAVLRGHSGRLTSVDFSPDGHRLASSAEDGTVRIWHVGESIDDLRATASDLLAR